MKLIETRGRPARYEEFFQFKIEAGMKSRLREEAAANSVKMGEVVRLALHEHLTRRDEELLAEAGR